ncbi:hypothetical protein [Rhodococcoides trifolii]|nr:hypothetical protein [Rhodococcus trifolii]
MVIIGVLVVLSIIGAVCSAGTVGNGGRCARSGPPRSRVYSD